MHEYSIVQDLLNQCEDNAKKIIVKKFSKLL